MKKIAVTGAGGFVGGAVVQQLRKRGFDVVPIVRRENPHLENAIVWDITHTAAQSLPHVDAVIHCAASVDDWAGYEESHEVNVKGTHNVIEGFVNCETFIYISSASVYDPKNTSHVITEQSTVGSNLLNAYSVTKYEGEGVVEASEIPRRIVIRPHIIYGPGDTTLTPRLKRAARFGRFLMVGDGHNTVSLTHIDNLTSAIAHILERNEKLGFDVYNIVDEECATMENVLLHFKKIHGITESTMCIPLFAAKAWAQLSEICAKIIKSKKAPLLTPYIVSQMTADHRISCEKAQKNFGHRPQKNYRDFLG